MPCLTLKLKPKLFGTNFGDAMCQLLLQWCLPLFSFLLSHFSLYCLNFSILYFVSFLILVLGHNTSKQCEREFSLEYWSQQKAGNWKLWDLKYAFWRKYHFHQFGKFSEVYMNCSLRSQATKWHAFHHQNWRIKVQFFVILHSEWFQRSFPFLSHIQFNDKCNSNSRR